MSKNDFCPYCGQCLCNENGGTLNPEDGLYYHEKCLKKKKEQKLPSDPNQAVITDKKT